MAFPHALANRKKGVDSVNTFAAGLGLTGAGLARTRYYAALSAASFSTSLCIDALFNIITAGQGSALVTAILEAGLVEVPFAVLSAALAVKLLVGKESAV
jgi:hypothetical protein